MSEWNGKDRRKPYDCPHDIEAIINESAKRGAKEMLKEIGIYEDDDKEFLRSVMSFMRGVKVGRKLVIWTAGVVAGLGTIAYGFVEIFKR